MSSTVAGERTGMCFAAAPRHDPAAVLDSGPLAVTDRTDTPGQYGDPLTPRQQQILGLLAEGYTSLQAQHWLGIKKQTYWNHVRDAKARIGAFTTTRAVVLFDRSIR